MWRGMVFVALASARLAQGLLLLLPNTDGPASQLPNGMFMISLKACTPL
jgi:hypothetical protein